MAAAPKCTPGTFHVKRSAGEHHLSVRSREVPPPALPRMLRRVMLPFHVNHSRGGGGYTRPIRYFRGGRDSRDVRLVSTVARRAADQQTRADADRPRQWLRLINSSDSISDAQVDASAMSCVAGTFEVAGK